MPAFRLLTVEEFNRLSPAEKLVYLGRAVQEINQGRVPDELFAKPRSSDVVDKRETT